MPKRKRPSWLEVFGVCLRLGLTSFGGPVAHLGYFREEFVRRRRWLSEGAFADLVAVCQFLPGPASSQVGMSVGLLRGGVPGSLAAWLGFTLPSALLMVGFAYGAPALREAFGGGWLQGLKLVAVAVVARAVAGMARRLCPDRKRATLAVLAAGAVLLWGTPLAQVAAIVGAGLLGWRWLPGTAPERDEHESRPLRRSLAWASLGLFFGLLIALPALAAALSLFGLNLIDAFYRVGSLVFGGGHVVLPLLQAEVVAPGWVAGDAFLAGYGAAQALPGPLFAFSAYLGTAMAGPLGGMLALSAIYVPSFLLVWGVLPFWAALRRNAGVQRALAGINAAVVGLLLAALYDPVFTGAVDAPVDAAVALVAYLLLAHWRWPPWLVVLLGAAGGFGLGRL